jgi:hypothetical protein
LPIDPDLLILVDVVKDDVPVTVTVYDGDELLVNAVVPPYTALTLCVPMPRRIFRVAVPLAVNHILPRSAASVQ